MDTKHIRSHTVECLHYLDLESATSCLHFLYNVEICMMLKRTASKDPISQTCYFLFGLVCWFCPTNQDTQFDVSIICSNAIIFMSGLQHSLAVFANTSQSDKICGLPQHCLSWFSLCSHNKYTKSILGSACWPGYN